MTWRTTWIAITLVSVACRGGSAKPRADAAHAPPPARITDAGPRIDAAPPPEIVEGQVERGDMLVKILKRHRIPGPEGQELIAALKPVLDFRKLQPGQHYKIVHRDGHVLEFELELTPTSSVKVVRGPDDKLIAGSVE